MADPFKWSSPLGVSTVLFLVIGAMWLAIGALTVPLLERGSEAHIIFVSERTDTAHFGDAPSRLLGSNSALAKYRTMMLTVVAGFLLLAGTMFVLVSWFGLRNGSRWALAALCAGGLLATALWVVALVPYYRAGIKITLADAPPFIWLPAILIVPATVLGWVGLR